MATEKLAEGIRGFSAGKLSSLRCVLPRLGVNSALVDVWLLLFWSSSTFPIFPLLLLCFTPFMP